MFRRLLQLVKALWEVFTYWLAYTLSWVGCSPTYRLLGRVENAPRYSDWKSAAYELDQHLGNDKWITRKESSLYDYHLIDTQYHDLRGARNAGDIEKVVDLLRYVLVRNLGNITRPELYTHAYSGTKDQIYDYVQELGKCLEYVNAYNPSPGSIVTPQFKRDYLRTIKRTFGSTALILRGGSAFGLCHLGVVRALHNKRLLPRTIVGTGTGALIAALIGAKKREELNDFLTSDIYRLSSVRVPSTNDNRDQREHYGMLWSTLRWLVGRLQARYLLDSEQLERYVEEVVGDMTFQEAFDRTGTVLNISINTDKRGFKHMLNHLSTPSVLIRTAAAASNISASWSPSHKPVEILWRDWKGEIGPWSYGINVNYKPYFATHYRGREDPIYRVAEQFGVNHYIISQARPYMAPFIQSELHHPAPGSLNFMKRKSRLNRISSTELEHRLQWAEYLGISPSLFRRFLSDDKVPNSSLTLAPELSWSDWYRFILCNYTSKSDVEEWMLRGERIVWPAVTALRVRCGPEFVLDKEADTILDDKDDL